MSGDLTVDTDAMRAHAHAVVAVEEGLREASAAAEATAMPDNSFGLLCSFLVPAVALVQDAAATGVRTASSTVAATRVAVQASAEAYDGVDATVQTVMRAIEDALS